MNNSNNPDLAGTAGAVYSFSLARAGDSYDVPLLDVLYRLSNQGVCCTLELLPAGDAPVPIDVKRISVYDSAVEGIQLDSYSLAGAYTIDSVVYKSSREYSTVLLRQKSPATGLWSTCAVRLFVSGPASRVTVWVQWLERGVVYAAPNPA